MPKTSARKKIGRFLQSRVGETVTARQLQEAAGNVTEWARRLRELRSDHGWKISSHLDRADLKPGEYVLEEPPPPEGSYKFEGAISKKLRAEILERNGYTCQMCGIGAGELMENGRKARMHVGHIKDRSHKGPGTEGNLRALCSMCNEGAKNLVLEPPSWTWLLGQVRRATVKDQREILKWLQNKFKGEA